VPFAVPTRVARRRSISIAAIGIAAATVVSLLPASVAVAAGGNTTAASLATAQQQADALGVQADKAVEAYNEASNALTAATAAQTRAQAEVAAAQTELSAAQVGIQALAASEYKAGTNSRSLVVLLSADPATVLSEADLLAQVSRYDEANVTKVVNADRVVLVAQASANQAVATHKAAAAAVSARQQSVQKAVKAEQAVVSKLTAQQKQQEAAAAAAASRLQEQQLEASRSKARPAISGLGSKGAGSTGSGSGGGHETINRPAPPASSGTVSAVLAYAYAQLGKPYRWGGAGPSSFDCSGLAMRAWAAAGVSLGHSTVTQQRSGRRVSLSALQPGDLVFWGTPAYHVGIYVGGGKILDAPHTGTDVQIQAIWGSPSSAVRL
jgi:cell wall-associated NlpC family hydrolase